MLVAVLSVMYWSTYELKCEGNQSHRSCSCYWRECWFGGEKQIVIVFSEQWSWKHWTGFDLPGSFLVETKNRAKRWINDLHLSEDQRHYFKIHLILLRMGCLLKKITVCQKIVMAWKALVKCFLVGWLDWINRKPWNMGISLPQSLDSAKVTHFSLSNISPSACTELGISLI